MFSLMARALALTISIPAFAAQVPGIRSDYQVGEIPVLCKKLIAETERKLDQIAAIPADQRTFQNTMLAYETVMADFGDQSNPLVFMNNVAQDPLIRKDGVACEAMVSDFSTSAASRRDLYDAVKDQVGATVDEQRLAARTRQGFESVGMKLPDAALNQVRDLRLRLSNLEIKFAENLTEDHTQILFTKDELKGTNPDYLAALKTSADGRYQVTTRESDAMEILLNAQNSETRHKFYVAYNTRGVAQGNFPLLQKATEIRRQIANLMGYAAWSDVQLIGRMAKATRAVNDFLSNLATRLRTRNEADLQQLLAAARESDPTLNAVSAWDINYYSNYLKKRDYRVDSQKVREYFPADVVISGIFEVYSKILGVTYSEVTGAPVWDPSVKLYEVRDTRDGQLIGHFYTDFFAREGKYNHAAAFNLIHGRDLSTGEYEQPLSAIVANVAPAVNGKPALLPHSDVITIFHEFGHVMHGVLTKAPYASLAGTSVARDFVEAPSQMLENWPWEPEVLAKISGHYLDHSKKLPADMLERMLSARDFQQGTFYTRQLVFATYDMSLHGPTPVADVNAQYNQVAAGLSEIPPVEGIGWPAAFGHVMGGYDAGYYSYLWSKVYAEDMFTVFKKGGVLSPEVGGRYRKIILERGDMEDAIDLVNRFLGRPSNSDAFFKTLHLLGS